MPVIPIFAQLLDRAELKITFDKQKLALHGLNASAVSMYVRDRVNGMAAGYLKEDGDESRCYIIDDNGTELDVYYTGYGRWALSADDDFVFEEYNGEEPEDE